MNRRNASPAANSRTTGPHWVLVAHGEVGILERLRHTVRNSPDLALVHVQADASLPVGAQVGIAASPTSTWWLHSLTAVEVQVLLQWLSEEPRALDAPPSALRHRLLATQRRGRAAVQRRP